MLYRFSAADRQLMALYGAVLRKKIGMILSDWDRLAGTGKICMAVLARSVLYDAFFPVHLSYCIVRNSQCSGPSICGGIRLFR
jgi:hypothetical protein